MMILLRLWRVLLRLYWFLRQWLLRRGACRRHGHRFIYQGFGWWRCERIFCALWTKEYRG